jgi:uncharacterized membrane protein
MEDEWKSPHRWVKCVVSMFVGMVIGVIIAEVVANSLIEISLTPVFSIVFGIAFLLLGVALSWRIWKSVSEPSKKYFMLSFAFLVFLSGIFSFFLEKGWVNISVGAKVPMYAVLGVSLSFALTFSLTEFINLGLCDKCCNTDFETHPLIGSKKQIFLIFSGSIFMGCIFGVLFGTIDVENDDSRHTKFKENLLWSIPLGAVIGGLLGFFNQYLRSSPKQYYTWDQNSEKHENI